MQVEGPEGGQAGGCGQLSDLSSGFWFSGGSDKEADQEGVQMSMTGGEYGWCLSGVMVFGTDCVGI